MAISAAFAGSDLGPESRRTSQLSEIWRVTGATGVATDTTTITPRFVKNPLNVIGGPCTFSVSSGVITITLKADIGNGAFDVEVKGGN
jgi:hypothetical protein